jgi:molecular chaperone GrpE (heat shock protein)
MEEDNDAMTVKERGLLGENEEKEAMDQEKKLKDEEEEEEEQEELTQEQEIEELRSQALQMLLEVEEARVTSNRHQESFHELQGQTFAPPPYDDVGLGHLAAILVPHRGTKMAAIGG